MDKRKEESMILYNTEEFTDKKKKKTHIINNIFFFLSKIPPFSLIVIDIFPFYQRLNNIRNRNPQYMSNRTMEYYHSYPLLDK